MRNAHDAILPRTSATNQEPSLSLKVWTFTIVLVANVLSLCVLLLLSLVFHWNIYVSWIIALSITTFIMVGYDKLMAARQAYRVAEIVLYLYAVAGGSAGAWLGMLMFRHKIRSIRFVRALLLCTAANIVLLAVVMLAR